MPPKDAWSVVVTTLALLVYGVLQERVMTRSWGSGSSKELFPYSAFLVLCNRLLTVAVLLLHSTLSGQSFLPAAPLKSYCMVSASNMVSTLCQYEALKYVSFVTQTLAKTAKALPVLLWGSVVGRRRYKADQFVHAVLITGGCSLFVLGGDITSAVAATNSNSNSWWTYCVGMCLLLLYLACDGWTSTQQEHLFKAYNTSIREQLLYTTAFSTAYSLLATLAGGQLLPALAFLLRHPSAGGAVLLLSAMSTIIQICISHVLQQHGALVFALMMTTRQCASVLLSSLLFGHMLSISQWIAVVVVFSTLYHQKAGKASSARRSTTGRLPHLRDSHHAAVPLLAKQVSQPAAAIHRHVSSAGNHQSGAGPAAAAAAAAGAAGKATAAVTTGGGPHHHTGSSSSSHHHHHHLAGAAAAAGAGAGAAGGGAAREPGVSSAGALTSNYMNSLQSAAVHVSAMHHASGPATPRLSAARSGAGWKEPSGAAAGASAAGNGSSGSSSSSRPSQVPPHVSQPASLPHHSSLPPPGWHKLWHQGSGPAPL